MSQRHVFSGHDEHDVPVWVAMSLHLREKQVEFLLYPKAALDAEQTRALREDWAAGKEVALPGEPARLTQSAEGDHLLPETLRADEPEMLRRVQNEWTLKLLSYKLYESIGDEVTNLQATLQQAGGYSQALWDKAKQTWDQVGNHAQDFNLSKKHAGELRDRLNGLFNELKKLREEGQDQLSEASASLRVQYEQRLGELKGAMEEGKAKVNQLFDQLKGLQKEVKDAQLTHRDRRKLWRDLDGAFNRLKEEKQQLWHSHLANRITGLEKAVERMQSSIDRDRRQIDFEARKLEGGRIGQLEHQLRQTRLKVMEDRIRSKEEKLADMHRTLQNLRKKEAAQRKAAEKRQAEEAAAAQAKAEADAAAAQAKAAAPVEGSASGEDAAPDDAGEAAPTPAAAAEPEPAVTAEPPTEAPAEEPAPAVADADVEPPVAETPSPEAEAPAPEAPAPEEPPRAEAAPEAESADAVSEDAEAEAEQPEGDDEARQAE
jgi:uncharacterized coiled-coil DUF342 family protein